MNSIINNHDYGVLDLKKRTIYHISMLLAPKECFVAEKYYAYLEFLNEALTVLIGKDKKRIEIIKRDFKNRHEGRFK